MYEKNFQVALIAIICLVFFGVSASAAPISYEYIYDTVDGQGADATTPYTTGNAADLLHDPSYTTYSAGELNDGWSAPQGAWDAGDSYDPWYDRYCLWDNSGGHQVGTRAFLETQPSIVAKFESPRALTSISVNYEVSCYNGIGSPRTEGIYVYFGVESGGGITWSLPDVLAGWSNANPAQLESQDDLIHSDIYNNTFNVSGMWGSSYAQYVRLDIKSFDMMVSLIEISFDGEAYNVPEPSTLALLGLSVIGLLCYAWRKRR